MSRTVLVLVAVGGVVIAAAVGVAWRVTEADRAAVDAVKPAALAAPASHPVGANAPAAASIASAPTVESKAATATPQAPPPAPSPPPAASVTSPSFDVARIGADGRAVIAGRAAPNARIVLLDGGKEIARGEADSRGEWVILVQDPPLAPGQHELRAVHHIEGRAPVTSEQVVLAVVPPPKATAVASAPSRQAAGKEARKDETLVLIAPPSGPSTLVQAPSAAGVPTAADLQVSTMDYDERGQTTITGQASPGASVRAYVDDKVVAESKAGPDGRWKLVPTEPVDTGQHRLRLDRLDRDGKPSARLEMPFERVAGAPAGDGRRLHVVRGDNLWNIARAHYGEGWRFTTIFGANKEQIRDPNLIYPGQVFSLPKVD